MDNKQTRALTLIAGSGAAVAIGVQYVLSKLEDVAAFSFRELPLGGILILLLVPLGNAYAALQNVDDDSRFLRYERNAKFQIGGLLFALGISILIQPLLPPPKTAESPAPLSGSASERPPGSETARPVDSRSP